MNPTEQQILDLIAGGENEKVEFKRRVQNEGIIAKVLTAFANTNGGYLIVGIEDDGSSFGLSDEEAKITMDRLAKICSSLFTFPCYIGKVKPYGKNLVYANIPKAPQSDVTTGTGELFIRKAAQNIKIPIKPMKFYGGGKAYKLKGEQIIGFVAMSFRTEEEPALIDYYNAMHRAVSRAEQPIQLKRVDLIDGDYEISQKIMDEIKNSDFVIADFTLSSHNVYFEVGFARAADKLIIQSAKKDTPLQFDVRNWTTLFYRNATELEEKLVPKFKDIYNKLTV